jgi:hypothetical protein
VVRDLIGGFIVPTASTASERKVFRHARFERDQ